MLNISKTKFNKIVFKLLTYLNPKAKIKNVSKLHFGINFIIKGSSISKCIRCDYISDNELVAYNPSIIDVLGSSDYFGLNHRTLITNGDFTHKVKQVAKSLNIKLINGNDLNNYMNITCKGHKQIVELSKAINIRINLNELIYLKSLKQLEKEPDISKSLIKVIPKSKQRTFKKLLECNKGRILRKHFQ